MKNTIKLIFLFLLCLGTVKAAEVNLLPQYKVFNDSENLGAAPGLKITMGNGIYVFGSVYKNLAPTYYQQQLAKVDLLGIGFGVSEKLTDNLKLNMDIGYYNPQVTLTEGTSQEAMTYYINDRVGNKPRHNFDYDVEGDFGASISLQLTKQVFEHCSFSLNVGYEALALPSSITAYDNDSGALNEFNLDLDCSGVTFGFGLTWSF